MIDLSKEGASLFGQGLGAVIGITILIVAALIHLTFAFGVFNDARHIRYGTRFAPPYIWALSVCLMSIPALAVYWVIHHSTLRVQPNVAEGPPTSWGQRASTS